MTANPDETQDRRVWTLGEEWAAAGHARILVIDNYDSFTYNLVQMLAVFRVTLDVVRNDVASAEELLDRDPDGIVLSPGPGRPEDSVVCLDVLRARVEIPVLGVCLGHQAMAYVDGATVQRAPVLMHGKTSAVRYEDHGMFEGLPQPFVATRYHSLCVDEASLSDGYRPLAWSEDGVLMAMTHRELPYWGVQFHPESVLSADGARLLRNFVATVAGARHRTVDWSGAAHAEPVLAESQRAWATVDRTTARTADPSAGTADPPATGVTGLDGEGR